MFCPGISIFRPYMLGFFRTSDPYRLIWLLLLMLALSLPWLVSWPGVTLPELKGWLVGLKVREGFLLYAELIDPAPPLAAWFYGLCQWALGKSMVLHHLVALLICFCLAAYYGLLLIAKRAFPENTLVPALVFGLVTLASFDMLALTAELPATVLLVIALKLFMDEMDFRQQSDEAILKLGLCLGLASLLVFSYMFFFPCFVVLLLLFTRLSLRRFFLMLTGFGLPHGLLFGYYLYRQSLPSLVERFYLAGFVTNSLTDGASLLWLFAVPLVFLLLSFFVLNRHARLTKYQSDLLQVMLLWLGLSIIHFIVARDKRPQTFLPAIPALSFILTHHFLLIKRKFAGLHVWVFALGMLTVAHLAANGVLPVRYDKLMVKSEAPVFKNIRLLDTSGNVAVYLHNTPAPPLLDKSLAEEILSQPNTFESVILIHHLFEKDPPEVVIDRQNYLEPFMQRIPALARRYRREGVYWIKVPNS